MEDEEKMPPPEAIPRVVPNVRRPKFNKPSAAITEGTENILFAEQLIGTKYLECVAC